MHTERQHVIACNQWANKIERDRETETERISGRESGIAREHVIGSLHSINGAISVHRDRGREHTLPKAMNARSKNNKTPRNRKKAPNAQSARPISVEDSNGQMRMDWWMDWMLIDAVTSVLIEL